jgi:hypothetical protein
MTFILEVASSVANPPIVKKFPAVRTVIVASSTKISKLSMKNPVAFQKEVDVYNNKRLTSGVASAGASPMPFVQTSIPFSEIKEGDMVIVSADDNIVNATSFVAARIRDDGRPSVEAGIGAPSRTSSTSPGVPQP